MRKPPKTSDQATPATEKAIESKAADTAAQSEADRLAAVMAASQRLKTHARTTAGTFKRSKTKQ